MTIQSLIRRAPVGRLLGLLTVLAAQLLYFPINRLVHGGVALKTPLDAYVPLWPVWAVPYVLSVVWWMACLVWAAGRMETESYEAFVFSVTAGMLVSCAIYLLFPTYVVRPAVAGGGWEVQWLKWVYGHDQPYNAFPSSHAFNTTVVYLFWRRWQPRQTWLWALISIVVLCSTLFTHQHYFPDLLGGIGLAWTSYRLGLWWAAQRAPRRPMGQTERA